ncbi:MAG: hypothetical protein WC582_01095 [Patescibacteria group bacterium]
MILPKKSFIIFSTLVLLVLVFLGFSSPCLALDNELSGLNNAATGIGYKQDTADASVQISSWIGMIVKTLIGFIGVVFMVLIWMGALDIIGAGGNDEMVKKGKDKIKNGVIGVLIVFAAYLLTYMILSLASGGEGWIFKF